MFYSLLSVEVKKLASSYSVSHRMKCEISREDHWPDSLPWPEWKPNTDKSYHPLMMTFSIVWDHGKNPRLSTCVNISGPRLLKNESYGADVKCDYFNQSIPEPFFSYVNKALEVANFHAKVYEQRD